MIKIKQYSLLVAKRQLPPVDIIFAVSATGKNPDKTFTLMKNSINHVIDKYGVGSAKYGLIVFGDSAVPKVSFSDDFTNSDDLQRHIETVPRSSLGPSYDKALEKAKIMFQSSAARPSAKKVLVIVVDKTSTTDKEIVR